MTKDEARQALKNAIQRLDYYGPPEDYSNVFVDSGSSTYELLAGSPETGQTESESVQLTLEHLRALVQE